MEWQPNTTAIHNFFRAKVITAKQKRAPFKEKGHHGHIERGILWMAVSFAKIERASRPLRAALTAMAVGGRRLIRGLGLYMYVGLYLCLCV